MKLRPNCYTAQRFIAPTFVAAGTIDASIGSISPGLPAGWAENDIHLAVLNSASGDTFSVPAGWASIGTASDAISARLTVMWRRAVAGDVAPTFADSGDHNIGRIIGFRGCVLSGNPWDVNAGPTGVIVATLSPTITGPTLTIDHVMCVAMISTTGNGGSSTTEFSGWTNANLDSITECIDNTNGSGNDGGIGAAYGVKPFAGAVGNTTLSQITNNRYVHALIGLSGIRQT